jgi:hypothetical protein
LMNLVGRTQLFNRSFMPSAIRHWNNIDADIRTVERFSQFRSQLSRALNMPKRNSLYGNGLGLASINQTRIRLEFSDLRAHLHAHNIIENPMCLNCMIGSETTKHYLLECPAHNQSRITMLIELIQISPEVLPLVGNDDNMTRLLVCGNTLLNRSENLEIFKLTQSFIKTSNRFHNFGL